MNMKRYLIFIFSIVLLQSCNWKKNVEPDYVIIVQENVDTTDFQTARQLRVYWKEVTGRTLAVLHEKKDDKRGIFLGKKELPEGLVDSLTLLKEDLTLLRFLIF